MTKFIELFPDDVSRITLEQIFYTDSDGTIDTTELEDWKFFNKHEIDITSRCMINGHLKNFVDEKGNSILDKIVKIVEDNCPKISNVVRISQHSVKFTIEPKSKLVKGKMETYFWAKAQEDEESTELKLPDDFQNLPWNKLKGGKIDIEYSGSGDDGGIDNITVSGIKDKSISERLESWIKDKADELVPSHANFNNEGSQGYIKCLIKEMIEVGKKTEKLTYYFLDCQIQHSENYEDNVVTNISDNTRKSLEKIGLFQSKIKSYQTYPMWSAINFEIDKDKSYNRIFIMQPRQNEWWQV